MGKTRHQCYGMGEGSTSLSCGVVCHQAWNDCGWFHQWRSAERLLLGLNFPQAVPRNLLLQRRAAMVQQVLKVLFRGLHIVLR